MLAKELDTCGWEALSLAVGAVTAREDAGMGPVRVCRVEGAVPNLLQGLYRAVQRRQHGTDTLRHVCVTRMCTLGGPKRGSFIKVVHSFSRA